jgi:hypothetical protein
LDLGYWWTSLYREKTNYYHSNDLCQKIGNLSTQIFAKLVTNLPFTFYQMGFGFYWTNKASMLINRESIYLGGHRLCINIIVIFTTKFF